MSRYSADLNRDITARHQFAVSTYAAEAETALDNFDSRAAIKASRMTIERAEMLVTAAVGFARQQGITWQAIADQLGITRQAAQQKYSR